MGGEEGEEAKKINLDVIKMVKQMVVGLLYKSGISHVTT